MKANHVPVTERLERREAGVNRDGRYSFTARVGHKPNLIIEDGEVVVDERWLDAAERWETFDGAWKEEVAGGELEAAGRGSGGDEVGR